MARDVVVLFNRTKGTADERVLVYKFDGRDQDLAPGENHGIPRSEAGFAIEQNKKMGTEQFYHPDKYESYVGIVGDKKWPCTPLEFGDAPQVIDRKTHEKRTGKSSKVMPADGPTGFDARMPGQAEFR